MCHRQMDGWMDTPIYKHLKSGTFFKGLEISKLNRGLTKGNTRSLVVGWDTNHT